MEPQDNEPHCVINGIKVPWPASGLTIEVPEHPQGGSYGPVAIWLHAKNQAVRIGGTVQAAVSILPMPRGHVMPYLALEGLASIEHMSIESQADQPTIIS